MATASRGGSHLLPAVAPDCPASAPSCFFLFSLPAPPPPPAHQFPSQPTATKPPGQVSVTVPCRPMPCESSKAVPRAWARGHRLLARHTL